MGVHPPRAAVPARGLVPSRTRLPACGRLRRRGPSGRRRAIAVRIVSRRDSTRTGAAATVDGQEPLWLVLCWLGPALVARVRSRMPMRVVHAGITACGLVLMCVPLILWIAWSRPVLYLTLLLGGLAALVLMLLVWLAPEDRI